MTVAPPPGNAKSLLASKVFWFNCASLAYAILQAGGWHPVPLNPEAQTYLTGLVNILLRLVTKEPVKIF